MVIELYYPFCPDFSGLDEKFPSLELNNDRGTIRIDQELDLDQLEQLRRCHPDSESWSGFIDQVKTAQQAQQATRLSAYPATRWSLLLSGLGSGQDGPWREFMENYRKPIQRSLAVYARKWNLRDHTPEELADDFFSWFCVKQYYKKLKRTDPQGKAYRFRGYLTYVIRHFLNDAVFHNRRANTFEALGDTQLGALAAADTEVGQILAREFADQLVETTLEVMKRDGYSSWYAFLAYFQGLTLEQVSRRLEENGIGRHTSVASAHRERVKACGMFCNWLLRYKLENSCLSREEASQEFQELIPHLANAICLYIDRHEGEIA